MFEIVWHIEINLNDDNFTGMNLIGITKRAPLLFPYIVE